MSESTGKGHQVPDSTSLSIRLATEYNEPTVPGTAEIVPSTKELTETTTAPGGLVQHTMASQKQSVCGSLSSPAVSGDVPRPLGYGPTLVTPKVTKDAPVASVDYAESFSAQSVETENRPLAEPIKSAAKTEVATYARTADARTNVASRLNTIGSEVTWLNGSNIRLTDW